MAIGSKAPDLAVSPQRTPVAFPCEAIPYLLSTVDALIILSAGLSGCFAYHWMSGTPIPDLSAYFALGLFASFIHVARLSGQGYYEFESAAKPTVEIAEVAVSLARHCSLARFLRVSVQDRGNVLARRFLDLSGRCTHRPSCRTETCQIPREKSGYARPLADVTWCCSATQRTGVAWTE
jgi:hypothetical protein